MGKKLFVGNLPFSTTSEQLTDLFSGVGTCESASVVTDRATATRVLRMARAARRDNVESQLGEIRVPTLVIWGEEDRITPLPVGRRFHALIADSQLWILTRCGHAPMLEQPHAFTAIVQGWLRETWPRRAQLLSAAEIGQ